MLTVLYIATDAMLSGSSASLMNLIQSLKGDIVPIVLSPDDGVMVRELDRIGVRSIVHPFYRFGGKKKKLITALHHPTRTQLYHYLTDDRRCARYVSRQLCNVKIDIVHSNSTCTQVGISLAKSLKAKHVWHIREFLPALTSNIYGGINRLKNQIRSADAAIFISNELKQQWNIQCQHPYVIMDAVRGEKDIVYRTDKQKYFLFCAANIYKLKRPDIAIVAFAESTVWKQGYRLTMLGGIEHEYKQYLLGLASSLHCADYIDWDDYTDNTKSYFENASAFLMCSDFEGLGRVTVEAMFYGCPVIGRNIGGTKDLIHDGYNGYLFNTNHECAQLINKVISVDNSELITHAHAFVKQELTEEVYGQKIMKVYHSIIG